MENVRKRRIVNIVDVWAGRNGARDLIARPNYHSSVPLDEELVLIERKKMSVNMYVPIFVGASILDISKTFMYKFFYEFVKKEYEDSARLLYTDTDSLIIEFKDVDIYKDMIKHIDRFDTSDYEENNRFNINIPRRDKKELGKMNDENKGAIMTEFIGLRAKMYSYNVIGKTTEKKAKGVKKDVLREIEFEDYARCLNDHVDIIKQQNTIVNERHEVFSMQQNKIAFSFADDKRKLIPNSYETLPWGHYNSMEEED